jgi:hypothetical protein
MNVNKQKKNLMVFLYIGRESMEDSQSDSNMFSIRIVSIDYYMATPISGLDVCYRSFQGQQPNFCEAYEVKLAHSDSFMYGKLPLLYTNDSSSQASRLKESIFGSHEKSW